MRKENELILSNLTKKIMSNNTSYRIFSGLLFCCCLIILLLPKRKNPYSESSGFPYRTKIEITKHDLLQQIRIYQDDRLIFLHINDYSDPSTFIIKTCYYDSTQIVLEGVSNQKTSYLISTIDDQGIVSFERQTPILPLSSCRKVDISQITSKETCYFIILIFLALSLIGFFFPKIGRKLYCLIYHLIALVLTIYYSLSIVLSLISAFKGNASFYQIGFIIVLFCLFISAVTCWAIWSLNIMLTVKGKHPIFQRFHTLHSRNGLLWPTLCILLCIIFDLLG